MESKEAARWGWLTFPRCEGSQAGISNGVEREGGGGLQMGRRRFKPRLPAARREQGDSGGMEQEYVKKGGSLINTWILPGNLRIPSQWESKLISH